MEEEYHVPQQSRRDKLRIMAAQNNNNNNNSSCSAGLLPFYDAASSLMNSMGFVGGSHHYLDPQSSLHINPSSIQYMNNNNNNPFLYTPQNLQDIRDFNKSCNNHSSGHQALSLSLSSHHQNNLHGSATMYSDNKVTAASGYVLDDHASASTSNEVSRGSILKGSKFLKPAQLLLDELCDVGMGLYAERISPHSSLLDHSSLQNLSSVDDSFGESRRTKSRLISMLDEVYRSYKQYYEQIQAVVTSFECVAGLGNAAPYANLALKAMSKHFRCLKNAITDQIQFVNKPNGRTSPGKDEVPMFGCTDRSLNSAGFRDHQPVWRPQRGLPERAVTVLRAWLFEHFLHPYPTDADKVMLAKQTSLSRGQVSNWFINARVRIWKPMVEEIHMLEQAQKGSRKEDRNANKSSDHLSSANSRVPDNPSTSTQRVPHQDTPSNRTRSEQLSNVPFGNEQLDLSYNSLSSHPHVEFGVSSMAGGRNGVSLTLGLHQNNGISLSEPFPMNAAQRFGLGLSNEGYVIGGFEAQNRHFERDVIGGQFLHDFVG